MNKQGKYTHGFKVPKSYFDDFEERIFSKIKEEQLPKESGFKVPESYFENLEEQILQRVTTSEKTKVIPLYKRKAFIYVTSIAACVAMVLLLYPGTTSTQDAVQIADIETYFDEEGLDWDSNDIALLLNEEDLENLPINTTLFSEESIENYLLENFDDTTLLIEYQ